MALVYTNATLSKITAVGTPDDYDQAAATGTDRWTGSVGVTVRGPRLEQLTNGRMDEIIKTTIELPYAIGVKVQRGDVLAYDYEGSAHSRVAGTIIHAAETGRVRIVMEDA